MLQMLKDALDLNFAALLTQVSTCACRLLRLARRRTSIQAHIVSIQYHFNKMDLGESISHHPALLCILQHLSAQSRLYSQSPEWRWMQRW